MFISAQALHQRLVDGGEHISLATVYRRLNAMADSGQADTVRMNGQQMFRLCGDERHHHHLVCVACGRTVQIDPPSETWLRSIAEDHGFTVESHTLEVFGLCAQCRHLVCVACGRTVQIDPPSETWLRSIAEDHGFTVESHTLEVFGLCAQCRSARAQSDGADAVDDADAGAAVDAEASSFGLNDESMPSASRNVSDGR